MKINSIFKSINGEVNYFHQGSICTFIRLQGCNLKCGYCDTVYARDFEQGQDMCVDEVIAAVRKLKCNNITITGGEPLVQRVELIELIKKLFYTSHTVSVETNGSILIPFEICKEAHWVIDYKGFSSEMEDKMKMENFLWSGFGDVIKFVIKDQRDFDKACFIIDDICKGKTYSEHPIYAFSPVFDKTNNIGEDPAFLVNMLKEKEEYGHLRIVLSLQLHKIINVA